MVRFHRIALATSLAALALSGCGGDGTKTSSGATDTAAATTAVSNKNPADTGIAKSARLTIDDFPSGWTANDKDDESETAECKSIKDAKIAASGRALTPTIENSNSDQFGEAVYIFTDDAGAQKAFAEVGSAETRKCLVGVVQKKLSKEAEDVEVGEVESGELQVADVADDTSAGRFTIPISAGGVNVDYTLDLVVVRSSRGVAFMTFGSALTVFDEELREKLTQLAGDRLAEALKSGPTK